MKRRSVVAFGADIPRATDELVMGRVRETHDQLGWLVWETAAVWTVAPQMGADGALAPGEGLRALQVKNRKLPGGVSVVGEGSVIPLHVVRRDGWRLDYTALVSPATPPAPWLLAAVGAKWVAAA